MLSLRHSFQSHPFGMIMPNRSYTAPGQGYRYGFNGQEMDDEVAGIGNIYDFGARIYDGRLGRWFSTDPLAYEYVYLSPYNFSNSNPVYYIDIGGKKFVNPYKTQLEASENVLDEKQEAYDKMVSEYNGRLTKCKLRKFRKESGLKEAQRAYDEVHRQYETVEEIVNTLRIVAPEKYNYFETLTNPDGTEVEILVFADDNISPAGSLNYAETKISTDKENIVDPMTGEVTGFISTGISSNQAIIILYSNGHNLGAFGNELGDIKYVMDYVVGGDEKDYKLWQETASPEGSNDDNYRNNKDGAGYQSFQYQYDLQSDFKKHVKSNKLEVEEYDPVRQIIYQKEHHEETP